MSYFEEILSKTKGTDKFYPESTYPAMGNDENNDNFLHSDRSGNLTIRGPVFTDEGSMRDSFSGTSLNHTLEGVLTFTNNSTKVIGVGTNFLTSGMSITTTDFIKLDADNDSAWNAITSIEDNEHLTLANPYSVIVVQVMHHILNLYHL